MTWRDRIENTVFTIRTGDGQVYTPDLPIGYETSKEFNTATFEYINVGGAEIARKRVKARQFPLTFLFTGENNIDQAEAFDQSCNDPRAWTVRHPMYGDITGQPLSVRRSDASLNATQFSVDFWETITTKNPVAALAPQEQIISIFNEYHELSPLDYESKVKLKPIDVSTVRNNADAINALISKGLDKINYAEYQQTIQAAFNDIDSLITQPVDAIRSMHDVIMAPARFLIAIDTRISLLVNIYNTIGAILDQAPTPNNKAYFETAAGVSVLGLATAMLSPLASDYPTRMQVINAANNLAGLYEDYLRRLDEAYVDINDPLLAFTPSTNTQNTLQDAVLLTLISMQSIAFNAKVERQVILTSETQLIPLVHKYMGLDRLDENIEIFRTINNIKNTNLFLIPQGTAITYYA